MAYENTSGMPFSGNLTFQGGGLVNGEPVNRSNAGYKTVGGFILSSDSNNSGLEATFGKVVSTLPSGDNTAFAIGKPSGYVARGIIMANNGVMQNEPAKSGYMLQDIPVTVLYEGTFRNLTWTKTQTGAIDPVVGCQIIYRATTGGTAGCDIGALEFLPAGAAIPTSFAAFPGYVAEYTSQNGVVIECNFDNNDLDAEFADYLPRIIAATVPYGVPFMANGTLTSAAAATPVVLIPSTAVPAGKKVYITGAFAKNTTGTVWATTTTVKIQDTATVPVDGVTFPVSVLTANAFVGLHTANVVVAAPVATNVGFTEAKGIQIVGDANGTGGDLVVTITGFIA